MTNMESSFMSGGVPQHAQESLPDLASYLQSDTHLAAHLASRFHLALPTAQLSSHALLSLNTYTSSTKGPNGGTEGSAMAATQGLASRAISRLSSRGENQAVIFLGESGSGKTTLRSHFLSSLFSLSSTPLSTKLSYAAFLFDTLTSTKSITTPTASKSGLFYELQYDTSATLIGGKLLNHRLERNRMASVPTGERSFHLLYYLLAGTSAAEKSHLGLETHTHSTVEGLTTGHRTSAAGSQKRWRYLGHPTQFKVGINDAQGFQEFKTALRKLEFPRNEIAEICQLLASILHIGQLEFTTTHDTTSGAVDSGGYSHEGGETVTIVKNQEVLAIVAAFLGVGAQDLETCFGYKTKTIHRERVTIMLDTRGARENADELAQTLYSLLVAYIIERINQRVSVAEDLISNTISVVDFPGFSQAAASGTTLDQLLNNSAGESLYNFTLKSFFEHTNELMEAEEVNVPSTSYFDNSDAVKGLLKRGNGLLSILDDQMKRGKTDMQFLEAIRKRFQDKNPAIAVGNATSKLLGSNFATENTQASFSVRHFAGEVEYPVSGLIEDNREVVSTDLMNLVNSTRSDFVRALFGQEAMHTVFHPQERTAIVQATLSSKPTRKPSVARKGANHAGRYGTRKAKDAPAHGDEGKEMMVEDRNRAAESNGTQGAAAEFLSSLNIITQSLSSPNTNSYFVFCLKPNDRRIANQFDSKCVRNQLQILGIPEMSQRLKSADFSVFLPFGEFLGLAESDDVFVGGEKEKVEHFLGNKCWPINEARIGSTGVLLSERCWAQVAKVDDRVFPATRTAGETNIGPGNWTPNNKLGASDSRVHLLGTPSPAYHDDKAAGYFDTREVDVKSDAGASAFNSGDMFRNFDTRAEIAEKVNDRNLEEVDSVRVSGSRRRWLSLVWLLTFWAPDFFIRVIGRMKRQDVRQAWREKLAINLLIWLSCGFVVFFIVLFPELICPKQYVFSTGELSTYDGTNGKDRYVAIRGNVFDLSKFMQSHYPSIIPDSYLEKFSGVDATALFPVQVSAVCQGTGGSIDKAVQMTYQSANYSDQTDVTTPAQLYAKYHDFRWATGEDNYRPTWFTEQMLYLEKYYFKGRIGYPPSYLEDLAGKDHYIAYIGKRVYDFTQYAKGVPPPQYPEGFQHSSLPDSDFMDSRVVDLFTQHAGEDLTKSWQALDLDTELRSRMQLCMDNLFYVGNIDTRNSAQCLFARWFPLVISALLATVIGFKFLAALQFGRKTMPEVPHKFLICTVPAYTEDEESLRRAIDSAAKMQFDDRHKLLIIICDGMIIGQGNDRPTPRIVLDILGVSSTVDPEPLSFESLGEGLKQHNMGKVYSGLYEVGGHVVPFLVVVKVGKPSEAIKPGNRGKRDSQMILMRFLNRIHANAPMTPLELEMHHQIKNVIGVPPTSYEYILQIDADTVVAPDSATRFIAAFQHDKNLIGVCGETALSNAKASMTTMIQVYEYYISHNLTKAFESLFGSVTCLPGCFSMYRIYNEKGKALFVSKDVVEAYAEIRVDTLHMKNLLHLGEDRYLTTLLLKHHSKYKTKYIPRAQAWTIAPDKFSVFLSQRRRWINSTVHNLMELIPLSGLCGFFIFSMRFVVFLDLLSTLVQPVIVGYLAYLIVLLAEDSSVVPITAFILLGAIYGLQALIFILHRKWEMIMWMLIYVLATPIFACALPLYAFWHMDDFSWGNTRVVTGDSGRKVVVSDEGKFDPRSIPRKRWEDFQAELWEAQSQAHSSAAARNTDYWNDDAKSAVSGVTYATKSAYFGNTAATARARSEYGNAGLYVREEGASMLPSRPASTFQHFDTPLPCAESALSLLHHRPTPSPGPGGMVGYEMHELGGGVGDGLQPSDDVLLAAIREVLAHGQLMSMSKKDVKRELEGRFGVSLEGRRAYIGSAIQAVLEGQL